ncbi:hypothetical protein AAF712_016461 [Marasmius tenuissimus]|uniref:Uncharacterized protein n=1 Tax=Marasmius tenuissimus TaxID=585030 RepID=A0ABR2Z6G4_9AGAR
MPPKKQSAGAPSHTVNNLKIKTETRARQKTEIEVEVWQWLADAKKKAEELAEQYNKTDRYFLDMMFQNGMHLTSPCKSNAYNVFKYFKAKENRDAGGIPLDVKALDELYSDEYDDLTDEEKADLVKKYENEVSKEEREKIKVVQPNSRSRAQDIANVIANISAMVESPYT